MTHSTYFTGANFQTRPCPVRAFSNRRFVPFSMLPGQRLGFPMVLLTSQLSKFRSLLIDFGVLLIPRNAQWFVRRHHPSFPGKILIPGCHVSPSARDRFRYLDAGGFSSLTLIHQNFTRRGSPETSSDSICWHRSKAMYIPFQISPSCHFDICC